MFKKAFALLLAFAMVAGMSAVSLASVTGWSTKAGTWATAPKGIGSVGDTIYRYDEDENALIPVEGTHNALYGEPVYIPLLLPDHTSLGYEHGDILRGFLSDAKYVEALRISPRWEMGGDMVDYVRLTKMYVEAIATPETGWYVLKGSVAGSEPYGEKIATESHFSLVISDGAGGFTQGHALDRFDEPPADGAEFLVYNSNTHTSTGDEDKTQNHLSVVYRVNSPAIDRLVAAMSGPGTWGDIAGPGANDDLTALASAASYFYFIEIGLKDSILTRDTDIGGTITLNKSKEVSGRAGGTAKVKDAEFDLSFNASHEENYLNNTNAAMINGNQSEPMEPGVPYLLKFDSDEDVDLKFGLLGTENEGTFTVDTSGQGKLLIHFTTDADERVVQQNPEANLRFINFVNAQTQRKAKFHRTGTFLYEWDDVAYAYELVTDEEGNLTLVALKDISGAAGEFSFKTSALGNYVFSDVALTLDAVTPAPQAQ